MNDNTNPKNIDERYGNPPGTFAEFVKNNPDPDREVTELKFRERESYPPLTSKTPETTALLLGIAGKLPSWAFPLRDALYRLELERNAAAARAESKHASWMSELKRLSEVELERNEARQERDALIPKEGQEPEGAKLGRAMERMGAWSRAGAPKDKDGNPVTWNETIAELTAALARVEELTKDRNENENKWAWLVADLARLLSNEITLTSELDTLRAELDAVKRERDLLKD